MRTGDRIYFAGDSRHKAGPGVITWRRRLTRYGGTVYDLDLDDGRELSGVFASEIRDPAGVQRLAADLGCSVGEAWMIATSIREAV